MVFFEYGNTLSYGSSVTAIQSPVTGNASTPVNAIISGLTPGTIYHFRTVAKGTVGNGTFYGSDFSLKTPQTVTDIKFNVYTTVIIGTKTWMAENLKTTLYNDGAAIPLVTSSTAWSGQTMGAYCWYNNDIDNKLKYGALYNWYAVNTNKLCPAGWHVPSVADWQELYDYLVSNNYGYGGGNEIAKSLAASDGWDISSIRGSTGYDQISNNGSRFSALPGGMRRTNGTFEWAGTLGGFWSATESNTYDAWYYSLEYNSTNVKKLSDFKTVGFSLRCIEN